jgi:hypothetical protein
MDMAVVVFAPILKIDIAAFAVGSRIDSRYPESFQRFDDIMVQLDQIVTVIRCRSTLTVSTHRPSNGPTAISAYLTPEDQPPTRGEDCWPHFIRGFRHAS